MKIKIYANCFGFGIMFKSFILNRLSKIRKRLNINTIGDNVKKFRKKKDLAQEDLARIASIPYTTLIKLESNVIEKPSVQTVAKIAKALKVSIEELIK